MTRDTFFVHHVARRVNSERELAALLSFAVTFAIATTTSEAAAEARPSPQAAVQPDQTIVVSKPLPESKVARLKEQGVLDADDEKEIRLKRPSPDDIKNKEDLVEKWGDAVRRRAAAVVTAQSTLAQLPGDAATATRTEAQTNLVAAKKLLSEGSLELQRAIADLNATIDTPQEEAKYPSGIASPRGVSIPVRT